MNYLPFNFVKAIHDEKFERSHSHQRRHNDSVLPRTALPPDPIGLLYSQIHSALDRGVARVIQAIFHAVPTSNEAGIGRKQQPLASSLAKQAITEAIPIENEKNNVTRYDARPLST